MGLQSSISTNQKKVQFALSTRAVCLCLRFFESFLHRQAKELFNYWQKPTQTRLKKGEKRAKTREFRFSFLFTFLHFFFSYAVAQEHCMFCGGLFVHGGESHHLFFCSAHLFVCWESDALVLSLCANETRRNESTVQERLINDGTLCFGCRTGRAQMCAPW